MKLKIVTGTIIAMISIIFLVFVVINLHYEIKYESSIKYIIYSIFGITIGLGMIVTAQPQKINPQTQIKINEEFETTPETMLLNIYRKLPISEQTKILHYAKYIMQEYESEQYTPK